MEPPQSRTLPPPISTSLFPSSCRGQGTLTKVTRAYKNSVQHCSHRGRSQGIIIFRVGARVPLCH